jgi:hypothetical protein
MVKLNRDVIKRVFASVDWGFTNPGVMQVWAVDGDSRMYLVHEVYKTGETIDWWKERAKEINKHYKPECFVCDPSEPAYISQLRSSGANAQSAKNEIRLGIEKVQERLKIAGDGRPRLFIYDEAIADYDESLREARKPLCTEQEMVVYAYPEGKDGRPIKEEPLKVYDHGCDALRYAVMYLDDPGAGATVAPNAVQYYNSRQNADNLINGRNRNRPQERNSGSRR